MLLWLYINFFLFILLNFQDRWSKCGDFLYFQSFAFHPNVLKLIVVQFISNQWKCALLFVFQRGFKLRSTLRSAHVGQPLPKSLCCLETTAQVKGMHTFIRYLFVYQILYTYIILKMNWIFELNMEEECCEPFFRLSQVLSQVFFPTMNHCLRNVSPFIRIPPPTLEIINLPL